MNDMIRERCKELAHHMIKENITVREAAEIFWISKSTVHKDVVERLQKVDPNLAKKVRKVLDKNKAERHLRGGAATKRKYEMIKKEKLNHEG